MKRPFFDTSILLAGLIDLGDTSIAPIRILDQIATRQIRNATTAWHCCLEFYSVATRLPEEYRLTTETAAEFIREEIIRNLGIRILESLSNENLFSEAAQHRISGGRIYDFHIGNTAVNGKVSVIVTENKKHFLHFEAKGISVLNANEYLNKLDP
ncbi:MAG TPA: PIN domain-containing protein [Opitutales bacterium]|nr:PIN domain-containing protein [Opitutales bacterium]